MNLSEHDKSLDLPASPTDSSHVGRNSLDQTKPEIIRDYVEMRKLSPYESFMFWVWNSFEQETPTNFGIILNLFVTSIVFLNVVLIMLRTEDAIDSNLVASSILFTGEILCGLILTIELACRVWGSFAALKYQKIHPALRRIRFIITFWAMFDLVNVTTQYFYISFTSIEFLVKNSHWLPPWLVIVFRIFRFLRLLRAQKTFNGLKILKNVFKAKWRELLVSFVLLICVTLGLSSIVYFFERDIQPEALGSIPRAFYFTMVTMSTIGYGDITCKTWAARGIVSGVVLWNLFLFSIPITIIAAGIVEEMTKETMAAEATLEHQRASIRRHFAEWKNGLDEQRKILNKKASIKMKPKKRTDSKQKVDSKQEIVCNNTDLKVGEFGTIVQCPPPENIDKGKDASTTGVIKELMDLEDKKIEEFMQNIQNDAYLDKMVEKGMSLEQMQPTHQSSLVLDPSLQTNVEKSVTLMTIDGKSKEEDLTPHLNKLELKPIPVLHVANDEPTPSVVKPSTEPKNTLSDTIQPIPQHVQTTSSLEQTDSSLDLKKRPHRLAKIITHAKKTQENPHKERLSNIIRMMEEFELSYSKLDNRNPK